ncbi:MAG TPA: sodium:calcium antiporter, partial [Xanthomonadales bacterium]|nr:sodium:calcium antiporter [Xanthomonadales bacterium]
VGNVVGSNIANVGLILGVSALLTPLIIHVRLLRLEIPLLLLTSLALWLLGMDGRLNPVEGGLLMLGFVGLMMVIGFGSRTEPQIVEAELEHTDSAPHALWKDIARIGLGFVLLLVASQMMVGAAVELARMWGMSELTIGLTIVAIGTSLPELAASSVAAWRGDSDIAVGNVLGSNLFNILLVLGATAVIAPIPVSPSLIRYEIPLMFLFAAALYPLAFGDNRIYRKGGALLLIAFVGFIAWQVMQPQGV